MDYELEEANALSNMRRAVHCPTCAALYTVQRAPRCALPNMRRAVGSIIASHRRQGQGNSGPRMLLLLEKPK